MMHAMDVARTHEILARYRPIAPRPTVMVDSMPVSPTAEKVGGIRIPTKTPKSRKRGRGSCASSFASQKRSKSSYVPVLPSPPSVRGFSRGFPIFQFSGMGFGTACSEKTNEGGDGEMLTLSLLPCSTQNTVDTSTEKRLGLDSDILLPSPVEKDLIGTLQKTNTIIVPQPVRPVGSSIHIESINREDSDESEVTPDEPSETKKPEEVEEEVELDPLPAVVSDSSNRVRLANSAYKEMVGQPECLWLDTMIATGVPAIPRTVSKRIGGEVMLDLSGSSLPPPSNRFSCRAKIKWTNHGQKKLLDAPCDVVRLACVSKDYLFTWRFHTTDAIETATSETSKASS